MLLGVGGLGQHQSLPAFHVLVDGDRRRAHVVWIREADERPIFTVRATVAPLGRAARLSAAVAEVRGIGAASKGQLHACGDHHHGQVREAHVQVGDHECGLRCCGLLLLAD